MSTSSPMHLNLGVVTPTFNRPILLRRYLRQLARQTYRHWRLVVVHDGPNPTIRTLVEGFRSSEARIEYLETTSSASDSGVTPRLEGLTHFLATHPIPDYVVLWDDDNSYPLDALERIAVTLKETSLPDLLLSPVKYGADIIPPANVPIRSLKVGQIDTAGLVFRPLLARDAYASLCGDSLNTREQILRFNDFLVYQYVNRLTPPRSIKLHLGLPVCVHDGLRWGPSIRMALGIPRLGLARLIGLGR
jgi:glycosyltransferase involved in cell wall biosynthesis